MYYAECQIGVISIHAPPRGATSETGRYQAGEIISIHAPPRGATRRALRLRMQPNDFNSRPSARGDVVVKVPICRAAEISIHAPPRGATFPVSESPGVGKISIHAPPRGATFVAFRQRLPCKFQFTPLREGRPAARATVSITTNAFQFTPLREGRRQSNSSAAISAVFQFTPLREGRPSTCSPTRKSSYFNSRPSARGDLLWLSDNVCPANFNSRPSARGDCEERGSGNRQDISIHAPPRGATNQAPTCTR